VGGIDRYQSEMMSRRAPDLIFLNDGIGTNGADSLGRGKPTMEKDNAQDRAGGSMGHST
jgi:hypothetical protein